MDFALSPTILWFLLALAALGVEMMIGSVYLLAVAAAAAFAGLAAKFGLSLSWQLAVCALFTVLGALLVRMRSRPKADAASKLMTLDAGQRVTVAEVAKDGTAVVQYRGAPWTARAETGRLQPGIWCILRIESNQLILIHKMAL